MNSLAIMQPYVFPYIGYFQLIGAVDHFVFLDNVTFIKKGWINRNFLYSRNGPLQFTVPLQNASQNVHINRTPVFYGENWQKKTLSQIKQNYSKAPFFKEVFPRVEAVFESRVETISDLAVSSVRTVMDFLGLPFEYSMSSSLPIDEVSGEERIVRICEFFKTLKYLNPIGGQELYSAEKFREHNILLEFIRSNAPSYAQFGVPASQHYSIIDVLMFNSVDRTKSLLQDFTIQA